MGQLHPRGVARRVVEIQPERGPGLQQRAVGIGERADPQLGPLQVRKDRDRRAKVRFDLPDHRMALADLVVAAMAHVQAEHVGPGLEQLADHLVGVGGRAERGHDLDVAVASHRLRPSMVWTCVCGAALLPLTPEVASLLRKSPHPTTGLVAMPGQ